MQTCRPHFKNHIEPGPGWRLKWYGFWDVLVAAILLMLFSLFMPTTSPAAAHNKYEWVSNKRCDWIGHTHAGHPKCFSREKIKNPRKHTHKE